jgi:hypothetical protein
MIERKTRKQIEKICHDYPDEVCEILLETPFWLQKLQPQTQYLRLSDDTRGRLSVVISSDCDSWIEVQSELNPHEFTTFHRFRETAIGGGQSRRVHLALRILGLAILLDNEERKQPLLPFARL